MERNRLDFMVSQTHRRVNIPLGEQEIGVLLLSFGRKENSAHLLGLWPAGEPFEFLGV
jgi:hypothetical protein